VTAKLPCSVRTLHDVIFEWQPSYLVQWERCMTWSLSDSQAILFSENAAWRDLWVTAKLPSSVRTLHDVISDWQPSYLVQWERCMTWSLSDSQATLFSENAAWRDLWVTVKLPCSVRTQQNLQDANLSTDYRLQTVLTSTTRHLLKLTGSAVSTSAAADTADTHTHTHYTTMYYAVVILAKFKWNSSLHTTQLTDLNAIISWLARRQRITLILFSLLSMSATSSWVFISNFVQKCHMNT